MTAKTQAPVKTETKLLNVDRSGLLQRKCDCGKSASLTGQCSECQIQRFTQQPGSTVQTVSAPVLHELIQPKLRVSEPGDRYEQEADRVAEQVMRMPEPVVQRQTDPEEDEEEGMVQREIANQITPLVQRQALPEREEEEEEVIQTKTIGNQAAPSASTQEASEVPSIVHEVLISPGQPLDPATRAFMESRFGHDFSDVRVHNDGRAAESAQAVGANAYTMGRDVVFAEGQYDTGGEQGQKLLAHELTHTIQQSSSASAAVPQQDLITIESGETALERTAEESASRLVDDRGAPAVNPKITLQRAPVVARAPDPQLNRRVAQLAQMAIDELDDRRSKKVLFETILAAARLSELPAFAAMLRAARDKTFGDHFVFLISEMEEDFGSSSTVSILQLFADAGVDITKLNYSLDPLAAVAKFKSLVKRFKALLKSGDLSEADSRRVGVLIAEAEMALRRIEPPPRKPGGQVQVGGAAIAAGVLWKTAGALAADDATGIGVADDVAIPFVIVCAVILSGIALFTGGPKPQILDYGPAKANVEAALRQMIDLLGISTAMAVQGPRASGQLGNVAVHLARLLALASVGGMPSGEPPKKNDRDDPHWWSEIKASLKNFFQATKGASRKQIMRELLKYYSDAEIAEIEAALVQAEELMGEQIGRILPP